MSSKDRNILLAVPMIVALVAVWFLILSPKQDQLKKLDAKVTAAETALATQKQAISQGVGARKGFPRAYHRLVVSGKAVPVHNETASLLVQIDRAASASGVTFQEIMGPGSEGSTSTDPTAAAATGTPGTGGALASTPYTLTFKGTFFQIADFISRMDRLVEPKRNRIPSDGRLTVLTGFTLGPDDPRPLPALTASLNLTTYTAAPPAAASPSSTAAPSTAPTDSTSSTTPASSTSTTTSTATTASAPTSP